jgi:hypothetical protein
MSNIPPPPKGFVLQEEVPPPPDGFVIEGVKPSPDTISSRPAIDVEANRRAAVGNYIESLPWYDRLGIGAREPIAVAGQKLESALGIPDVGDRIDPALSAGAQDTVTNIGRAIPAIAATSRIPMAGLPAGAVQALGRAGPVVNAIARVAPSVAGGAAYGAATNEDSEQGAVAGATGAGIGYMAGTALGRLANGIVGNWANRAISETDDFASTLDDFQRAGGKLSPGQASGGRGRQFVDEALANNPVTGTGYASIEKHNQQILNKSVAKALGINLDKSGKFGPAAFAAADDVINREFTAVAQQIPEVPLAPGLAEDLSGILSQRTLKPFADKLAAGRITGRDYMDLRSKLLKVTRSGSDKVQEASNLIDDLDDMVDAVAPESYKPAYAAARERYKTLLAVDRSRQVVTGGNVNPLTMANSLWSIYQKQYSRGADTLLPETGNLFTVVRAMSDPRMAPLTGGSQTARRVITSTTLGGAGVAGVLTDPVTTVGIAGGALLAPRAYLAAPAGPAVRRAGVALGVAGANALQNAPTDNRR